MFKNIYFFNWYGNGDILNSKEYVRELAERMPEVKFYYLHPKNPRIFEDMGNLFEHGSITEKCDNSKGFIIYGDDLYFNTWIGRDSRYVLPGITCTDIMNRKMFNDILETAGMDIRLERPFIDYIPSINFNKLQPKYLMRVARFLTQNEKARKILICNGDVQSNQATNFDFGPVIENLCKLYPEDIFIATTPFRTELIYPNLYFTSDIIKADDGFDLNEIGYLSRKVVLTIGRASGPSVFTQHKENMLDPTKKFLVFSNHPDCITFMKGAKSKVEFFWSGETQLNRVYEEIKEVLDKYV